MHAMVTFSLFIVWQILPWWSSFEEFSVLLMGCAISTLVLGFINLLGLCNIGNYFGFKLLFICMPCGQ